jgi:hypothetical protein
MRLASVWVTACLCTAAASVAWGDVWMWKDASGEAHYSDQPVEGAVRVKATIPRGQSGGASTSAPAAAPSGPGPGSPKSKVAAANEAGDLARNKTREQLAVQEDVARKQDEQCKQAKDVYDKSISARRIYKTGQDGEREFMSDAEADEYRVKARADMDAYCGKAPGP